MKGINALCTDNRVSSAKKVSWEALQNLCQVRLFAAEDLPSSLGTSLQESYQEKETKFLQVAKPLSENDLPPGFVKLGQPHLGSGANPKVEMHVQVHWRCPDKFLLREAWQVAAGIESTELIVEQSREFGALEFFFPRISVMPDSPGEPLEILVEIKNPSVSEIPAFSVEDEDEVEDFTAGRDSNCSLIKCTEKNEPREKVDYSSGNPSSFWSANQVDQRSSIFMKDADQNVAAAAAAAYAVLKAKERGTLVDHNVLIKILTSPILIKTLLQCKQSVGLQLRAASEEIDKNKELGKSLGSISLGSKLFGWPIFQGSKGTLPAVENVPESASFQAWNAANHFGSTRPFLGTRDEDKLFPWTAIHGMGIHSSQFLLNRQDSYKDIMRHEMDRSRIDDPRGLREMEFINHMNPLSAPERHRPPVPGPLLQFGPASQHAGVPTPGRGDGFPHARYGGEQSQSRFQKPCIYFNTAKGCRRGATCFYMHNTASDQPFGEQTRAAEFLPFQSAKRQKFGMREKD